MNIHAIVLIMLSMKLISSLHKICNTDMGVAWKVFNTNHGFIYFSLCIDDKFPIYINNSVIKEWILYDQSILMDNTDIVFFLSQLYSINYTASVLFLVLNSVISTE